MKKNILFVDDESNILQGLKRSLRGQRHVWNMTFSESGEEALSMLADKPFDAVVSDMRMPGMDGAELLDRVKRSHPNMVRFVLSGHSDQELIMRSVGTSHQYIAKPCEPETLKSRLEEAFALQGLLSSEKLQTVVSGMTSIPSLPEIYQAVHEALKSDKVSINTIGKLIEQDPAMAAKVLQLVNSAYFGISRQINRPSEAASFLGLDILKALLLSEGIFTQFDQAMIDSLSIDTMKNNSFIIANNARKIAKTVFQDESRANQAFLAGLLHDIGTLILAVNLPDEFLSSRRKIRQSIPVREAEKDVFGTTHAEVAAYTLALWGIDNDVVAAVAYHHNPEDYPGSTFSALTALYIADNLLPAPDGTCSLSASAKNYLHTIGYGDSLAEWSSVCTAPADGESLQ